jgi:hypothetical protein
VKRLGYIVSEIVGVIGDVARFVVIGAALLALLVVAAWVIWSAP